MRLQRPLSPKFSDNVLSSALSERITCPGCKLSYSNHKLFQKTTTVNYSRTFCFVDFFLFYILYNLYVVIFFLNLQVNSASDKRKEKNSFIHQFLFPGTLARFLTRFEGVVYADGVLEVRCSRDRNNFVMK